MKEMHKRSLLVQDFFRLRWLFFVPLAVLVLFLPFSAWQRCKAFQLMGASGPPLSDLMFDSQVWCSFFSLWWPFFILKEYIEGDGNELLFTARRARRLLPVVLAGMVLWLALCGLLMVGYSVLFGSMVWNYLMIVIQTVLYTAVFFFLCFLLRSAVFGMMVVFIYHVFAAYFLPQDMQYLSIFVKEFGEFPHETVVSFWPLVLCSAVVLLLGVLLNRRYRGTL